MLSLPNFNFKPPHFSLRFFIFSLFTLVILMLLVEVGYFFCFIKNSETCGNLLKKRFMQRQTNEFEEIFNNPKTVTGELVSISKEKLVIEDRGKRIEVFLDNIEKVLLINPTKTGEYYQGTVEPVRISKLKLGQTVSVMPKKVDF